MNKSNKEWVDLLSREFNVSRTTARDMLHCLFMLKREDAFKRFFNPIREAREVKKDEI